MWTVKLFLLSWLSQATLGDNDWANAGHLPQRILDLIAAYNERGAKQIYEVNDIRADNENNAPFEMGYVMSEILERYRQMVGLAQRARTSKMDSLFEVVKHTELIQKLYLEIFHLVNMFHEIGQKYYRHVSAGAQDALPGEAQKAADAAAAKAHLDKMIKRQKEIDRIRHIEKKKKMKQLKKDREMYLQQGRLPDKKIQKPNRWWPIDYGWEVEHKWW